MLYIFHTYVASIFSGCCVCFTFFSSSVFKSVLDASFKCFVCFQTYVASVASGCFKSRLGVASRSLLAFDCLASVSPPSLGTGWASKLEAQAGAALTPSSRCWRRGGGRAAASGVGGRSFCSVVPLRVRALLLLRYSVVP